MTSRREWEAAIAWLILVALTLVFWFAVVLFFMWLVKEATS